MQKNQTNAGGKWQWVACCLDLHEGLHGRWVYRVGGWYLKGVLCEHTKPHPPGAGPGQGAVNADLDNFTGEQFI